MAQAIGMMGKNTLLKKFFFTLQHQGEYESWSDMIEHSDEESNITPHEHLGLRIIGEKHMVLDRKDGYWTAHTFQSSTGKVISVDECDPLCALLRAYLESVWGLMMPTPIELMRQESEEAND